MSGKFSKLRSELCATGGCAERESSELINNLWQKIYGAVNVNCANKCYCKFNNYKINDIGE